MVKILDFWATWCVDPQTPILTEDGYLKATEIKIGQKLVTVDPKTFAQSTKRVQKTRTYKSTPSIKIALETGRVLIGDANHKVLTPSGFKSLKNLQVGEKVLVDPQHLENLDQAGKGVILETSGNNFADKFLKQQNLLPLKEDNPKLQILARLLGFVMTDGYLYEDLKHNIYETHFFVGTEKDALAVKEDLQVLGFSKLEIKKQSKARKAGSREYTITILRCRNFNRSLFFLLKALGSPAGRKKNQAYFIPEWIMDGSPAIKNNFLRGWLGGDGCKIAYFVKKWGRSSHWARFSVNAIEFHKEKELEREGVLYAQQLGLLLEEQVIKVREVSSCDDEDGVIISLKIATDYESLLKLAEIGYAYAATKNANIPFVREFLRYRLQERNRYGQIKKYVLEQLALGASNKILSDGLQVPMHTIVSWRYSNREATRVNPPKNGQAIFTKWLIGRQEKELIWEKVIATEEVEARDVIGITVGAPHTIITNGIVSHNCGPCKFMESIIEELEQELKGRVEVEKINVDENQELTSQNQVMSIPTYIFLKDGKEVDRIIGATPKENFLQIISKHE